MCHRVQILRLPDGSLAIGFLMARLLIAVVPSAVEEVIDAILGGISNNRASLNRIAHGPHKGQWTLGILGSVFRLAECDVTALKAALRREFSH